MTLRERRKRIKGEHVLEEAAEAKRKQCKHINAVEVTNRELGRVAWWCEECETQLPAEWEKPVNGWGRPITGTPFLVTPPSVKDSPVVQEFLHERIDLPAPPSGDSLASPDTVCCQCGGTAERAYTLFGYTAKDWGELNGKPLCRKCDEALRKPKSSVADIWKHHIEQEKPVVQLMSPLGIVEFDDDPNAPGWTIQKSREWHQEYERRMRTAEPRVLTSSDVANMTMEQYQQARGSLGIKSGRGIFG